MLRQIYVFKAALVDFTDIRRTIAMRSTQTLDDLHHTLRAAFEWDDEHLYSFGSEAGSGPATAASTRTRSMRRNPSG